MRLWLRLINLKLCKNYKLILIFLFIVIFHKFLLQVTPDTRKTKNKIVTDEKHERSHELFKRKLSYKKPSSNQTASDCHLAFNLDDYLKNSNDKTQDQQHAECKHIDWIRIDDNGQMWFDEKYLAENSLQIIKCTYSSISWNDDFHYKINSENIPIENGSYLNENIDLFVVSCKAKSTTDKNIVENLFGLKYRSAFARINKRLTATTNDHEPINVMFFGLDSVSKALWLEHLPKSSKFLLEQLNAKILNRFNVVGDGTPPAIIGLLTGKYEHELPNTIFNTDDAQYVDEAYPFIWKQFTEHLNYASVFAEDWPSIGVFNYRMIGMSRQPTTHYMRPLQLALVGESMLKESSKLCIHGRKQLTLMLDYVFDFMRAYVKQGFFGFSFLSEYTHDPGNKKEWVDGILVNYLEKFVQNGLDKNTILILFSDHGPRFSDIRASIQGLLEERNPFISIHLPELFRKRYPSEYELFQRNVNTLTTPFDIHATLLDLLSLERGMDKDSGNEVDKRANSLFREMKPNRTCTDAGIDAHWCSCLTRNELEIDNYAVHIAQELMAFINSNLLSRVSDICENLRLHKILKIYILEADKGLAEPEKANVNLKPPKMNIFRRFLNFFIAPSLAGPVKVTTQYEQYQLLIETLPNNGLYEATVVIERNIEDSSRVKFKIDENLISRINKYGNQSVCVHTKYPELRKYCLCK